MPLKNKLDQVLRYPTPVVGEMMFHERIDGSLPQNKIYVIGQAHWDTTRFPYHKLCYVEPVANDEDNLQYWHYLVDRDKQDEYNWERSTCSIGGRKFDSVVRTYVTLRTEFDPNTPALGSAMPVLGEVYPPLSSTSTINSLGVAIALFGTGYVLAEKDESRTDNQQIDNLYVIEKRVYVKKAVISALGYDEIFGGVLPSSVTLYHRDEVVTGGLTMLALSQLPANAYWGLQGNGVVRTWEQLSTEWYVVKEQTVVPGTFVNGVVTLASYSTNQDYDWPAVLSQIEFMDWDRRDGGVDIHPRVEMAKERYAGPCKAIVTVTWAKTPFIITKVPQMLPTSIYYSAPFFRVNVAESLHGEVALQCDIGSTDPVYSVNGGSTRTRDATNYTDWPATITAADGQKQFRGGYLRTVVTIYKPE